MGKVISSLELTLSVRAEGTALGEWLYEELRLAIADGRLKPGVRLPSTREFARRHCVSRRTVVTVFERLALAGYLRTRVGSGTWVKESIPSPPRPGKGASQTGQMYSGPLTGLRYPYPARPFRMHEPALHEFPVKVWTRVAGLRMRKLSPSLMAGYNPAGYTSLRAALASYLGSARGVKCATGQIVITSGTQQSLDILSRLLLKNGDPVWLEEPGYFGAAMAFSNAGAKIIPVPVDEQGLCVSTGRKMAARAKCAYVTPGHQFPLGMTMPPQRRLELLAWAAETGAYIIEDDYDSEFRFDSEPVPSLQGSDRNGRVILIGTLNKLLFPTVRLGYAVLPPDLVDSFHRFRFGIDLNGTSLLQAVVSDFITEGHFARHIQKMRKLYNARLAALLEGGQKYLGGLLDISPIRAGLITTGVLRNGMTSQEGEAAACASNVETAGVHRFTLGEIKRPALLLGFAAFDETQIREGLIALAAALEGKQRKRTASRMSRHHGRLS
jgi:GntR family transcriptional regulator / MocR family aminotransferase